MSHFDVMELFPTPLVIIKIEEDTDELFEIKDFSESTCDNYGPDKTKNPIEGKRLLENYPHLRDIFLDKFSKVMEKYMALRNKNKITIIQNKALELSMFLSLPATAALFVGSNEILSGLFGYGSFSLESVENSAKALYFFGLGLPAFALIKVFSSFFFANHDTKTPFYISLVAVILNIILSVYYFKSIGFIIIPIATTISSWFNSIVLFIYLKKNKLFEFNKIFISRFLKIIFVSFLMGVFFKFLMTVFENQLNFDYYLKSVYLIITVLLSIVFYIFVSFLIKAFKIDDIKLKY